MAMTKEEHIHVGDTLATNDVLAQLDAFLLLASEDAERLGTFGWMPAATAELRSLADELRRANRAYEDKSGVKVGSGADLRDEIRRAKVWRERAISIGENALAGDAQAKLHAASVSAVGLDGTRMGERVAALLDLARRNEAAYRAHGADDAFFADGRALAETLGAMQANVTVRRVEHPAEHDALDLLDGRAWEKCKLLARTGRRAHRSSGDRNRANAYNLDLSYGRAGRIAARKPPAAPAPAKLA